MKLEEATRQDTPPASTLGVSQTDALARAFLDCTLDKSAFTHEAHLRVGLWHLRRYSPDDALDRLRIGIRRFNESVGGVNTDSAGYHETITRFYVWQIGRFLESADGDLPLDALANALVTACGDKNLPLRYWSRERLFSVDARVGWVEPDLATLV